MWLNVPAQCYRKHLWTWRDISGVFHLAPLLSSTISPCTSARVWVTLHDGPECLMLLVEPTERLPGSSNKACTYAGFRNLCGTGGQHWAEFSGTPQSPQWRFLEIRVSFKSWFQGPECQVLHLIDSVLRSSQHSHRTCLKPFFTFWIRSKLGHCQKVCLSSTLPCFPI